MTWLAGSRLVPSVQMVDNDPGGLHVHLVQMDEHASAGLCHLVQMDVKAYCMLVRLPSGADE